MILQIDEELRRLIPPLSDEERAGLEQDIINDGYVRVPIDVWGDVIVDGHHRYEIATKHNISYTTNMLDFPDKRAARIWMRRNQLHRRNLNDAQRIELVADNDEDLRAVGREKQKETLGGYKHQTSVLLQSNKTEKPHNTRKELADEAGVSDAKMAQALYVRKHAPEQWEQAKTEGLPIRRVYDEVKKQEKQAKKQEQREQLKQQLISVALTAPERDDIAFYHQDCLDFLPTLEDNSIDLIVIDPPYYGIVDDAWDNQWPTVADYLEWCEKWVLQSIRILKPTGSFYLWGSVGAKGGTIVEQKLMLDRHGLEFRDWITWQKRRGRGSTRGWLYTREDCLWYVKNRDMYIWNEDEQYGDEPNQFKVGMDGHELKSEFKRLTNVWTDIPEQLAGKGTLHYTPKPVKAIERIIKAHTAEGDVVLDFFSGSGTTGVACKHLNRRCILVDVDEQSYIESKARVRNG